jgi:hypothetical protein
MIKVSVIIPVYNGEDYIKDCLDSVLNQTLKDIQIIIINDGSIDNTQSILEEYYSKYPDIIKIVNKENEGQGKARNIGIGLAQGEFITFVDADDTIEPNMLEKLYNKDADVILCDYYELTADNKNIVKAIPIKTEDIKKDFIVSVAGPCNKLIRTSILNKNDLLFLDTGIYEDIAIIPLIVVYANKITYIEEPLYNYYIRQGSTMRQNSFNGKLLSIYNALITLSNGFIQAESEEKYKDELEFIYIKHLLYAGTGRFLEYKEGKKEVKRIVKIIKTKYPKWRRNKYYKQQSKMFKLNCNIFYTNNLLIIMPFQKLKNIIKRGKQWTN